MEVGQSVSRVVARDTISSYGGVFGERHVMIFGDVGQAGHGISVYSVGLETVGKVRHTT